MATKTLPGGTFTLAEDLTVTRMGYGAMQLAGPHVFGPPADRDAAAAVLAVFRAHGLHAAADVGEIVPLPAGGGGALLVVE